MYQPSRTNQQKYVWSVSELDKKKHRRHKRLYVQAIWTALTNGYIYGFVSGKIYTGRTKGICVPGLNCYSCPGALGSCPIGSLQSLFSTPVSRPAFYCLGILVFFGSLFGRFVCGWLCPFGLVEELLYKIPIFSKRNNLPGHKYLKYLKYIILVLFVFSLPLLAVDSAGIGSPWFCEYICPSGTLFGGIPLVTANESLRSLIGARFWWKIVLLIIIITLSVKTYRPFCKYLCPLGAFYSIFNSVSLYRYELNEHKCTKCGKCEHVCKMGIKPNITPNSTECIRCGECIDECPENAIKKVSYLKKDRTD